ncbi:MAG: excinuclease ABC subunit UvrC [Bacteroidales bacterium]|nr:excinuclease ABC subunit UvrC [Bacteroidales bacterium]MBN2758178.1 excinuclease ABC subunit UvrC [Bacteroidales bacterium]
MPEKLIDKLKLQVKVLPEKPGVYQYFDKSGKIIYVGKAKNLKKRVASYFTKSHESAKTRILVRKIFDIKHIVVETETDALLLENNLIKKYQPRYNVLLKDDKSYPWICIKNERFPRVFYTRNVVKDGSEYFGPYASVHLVRLMISMFKEIYKLRTCKHNLSSENINTNKFKVCLEYHIGNCLAPCIGKQRVQDYDDKINYIRHILKGNIHTVIKLLKEQMHRFSDNYEFENANQIKENLKLLETYESKSTIVNPKIDNVDVFSIIADEDFAYVNYLKVANGSIIQVNTIEIKKKLDESKEDLLIMGIIEIRNKFYSVSKEIIVPFDLDFNIDNIKFIIPQIGDKKKLLELSEKNVKFYRLEKKKHKENIDPLKHTNRILSKIKDDLHLPELPVHIECFDNSNIQGNFPVAACVVFKNAKPAKKDYRHFNIKTVEGIDDFASMKEIIFRRYKRLLDEKQNLPQLIIVDGGKGQLSSAVESLDELNLRGKISIIGIAKRLEEIYFPNDPVPLYIDKNSETLKIIQQARNEAHRFGITFHRDKRSKGMLISELDEINGVGEKTKFALIENFKTIANIKNASVEELKKVVKSVKAEIIFNYFNKSKKL